MKKISYRLKLLSIYVVALIIILALLYSLLSSFDTINVGTISKENFKSKSQEREEYLHEFFYPYFTSIKSIQQSELLKQYLSNELPQETIENYFLNIKKSLPSLRQVSFIDNNGLEKVKIDGTPIDLFKEKAVSKIISKNKLQNKSEKMHIQKFLKLKKGEIGLYTIELYKENGKITTPKQPILRVGMAVYNNLDEKQGIIVFNISLQRFFQLLNKTTLYNVYLIDKNGLFLNHHDPRYGLLGDNPNYTIFDAFANDGEKVLINTQYFGEKFYSSVLKNFNNGQELRLLLELKYSKELEKTENIKKNFLFFTFILSLVFLIMAIYLSKLPDTLKKKAEKDKFINKLTRLPNRLALMQNLSNNKFQNSLVILISANNILKIQNTYGYQISNDLLKQLAAYLKEYNNGIEKVYTNSYNVFVLKYLYSDKKTLDQFLANLITAIEQHPFVINIDNNKVEFAIEITVGVSDPNRIHNSIEVLNEAENALEYALDNKTQLEIFSSSFYKNIKENKENLLFAKKIKKAIDNNGIILHFQPIYNNYTEKIEKYESLIRMRCEDQLIFPDKFLPIAKQINKYNVLSYIVIDKAFAYFKDKECEFSINISILDIKSINFQEYLFERLKHYGISNKLVLEIVEQDGVDNYGEFFTFIKKVKAQGCKIAIDDFGSGYSNYEYIINSSEYIDYLKIDGSLIKNLPTNSKTQILIGSLKFLCDNLGIKTIAEYVEDAEVLKYVQSIGIDYSQGYHIGKPLESIEIELSGETT